MTTDPNIQRKAPFKIEHGIAYESGQRVPVVGHAANEPDDVLELLADLADIGVTFPDIPAAREVVEQALEAAGDRRGAEALAWVFNRLPGGRRGAELRAALLGFQDAYGQALADQFGTSRQSIHQRINRLRDSIFKKR